MFNGVRFALAFAAVLLAGCSGLEIDRTSYQSRYFDSRISWVVVHYTSADFNRSVELLTRTPVSSHYLISEAPVQIYQLVDEQYRAWHAGESSWQGRNWLNANSIGIELVHEGYRERDGETFWPGWNEEQIEALVLLLKDIIRRHDLPVDAVLGHSDIAPQRKVDPGPAFPWFRLAQEGMITWPQERHLAELEPVFEKQLPDARWFQQKLAQLGYGVELTGEFDKPTWQVLRAVQMKYRPSDFSGVADAQTAAILWSLVQQKTKLEN